MRLALVARVALATIIALAYFSPTKSVNAQEIVKKEKILVSLSDQNSSNSDLRNKQRYDYDRDRNDRDRYDGDRNDRDRYDRGSRSRYYDEINRLYRQVLGRNADNEEIRTRSRQLERGKSQSDIRRELAYSREAENAINNIYRRVLGRNVDRNGLRTWQSELAKGKSLRDVEQSIQRSSEGRNKR